MDHTPYIWPAAQNQHQPMRAVIQRVSHASVTVDGQLKASIGPGLLIFAGFVDADTPEDISWISRKIAGMRIFNDEAGIMNRSVTEVGGALLVVSQFTLHAQTKKGNRPSYSRAAKSEAAIPRYELLIRQLALDTGKPVQTGVFGADMKVSLLNDGPVTIVMDSEQRE